MALHELSRTSARNEQYLLLFRSGDERALNYFYKRTYDSLLYIGRGLVNDEFLVSCILHECYLKVWAHRDKIESLPHAYRFIRLNLRWQVLKQVQKPAYQIYRKMTEIDHLEPFLGEKPDLDSYFADGAEGKRWNEISKAISFLPKERQLIASLHFQDGHSPREVAKRIGANTLRVTSEIQKAVEDLKKIVAPKATVPVLQVKQSYPYDHILSSEQAAVFALRQDQKKSFADIASILGYPQTQVQQYYIKAYQLVKNHWKQNGR
ncbi:DNA-directed RNA polymerase specialized sigma24 family protein [Dyadobacter sp. BE34]|uniref:DNA-directed RNA polymerase specialized sigma24 family protein n=1 Tax=Dyadobacter fermentans TaxID=94254 RepID=A0ABU1QU73_9BACT|nr:MULTISPECIES: sigma-70 family RNA polymerase sigma factor [Dyadobacter]MDR6804542.1 DNA-directed RNA polymerase specialized sigma24 family protein [Dyadobacter fermentans]MDR7042282.1 DNA-directed RNA polymerase specialized sigma24 family protein [Dyadobacter sp. BE242]MDR7196685.1 DNA-directed RNA polymerase specialized sigma24 family protein [Dyadobacter sp. BE34]MDR7212770.1 DNA-directed RNA polymerase specialized sigma24 family protein [Dyadobacter sp. BE31]MDR7262091.1 DNA-directed RNA